MRNTNGSGVQSLVSFSPWWWDQSWFVPAPSAGEQQFFSMPTVHSSSTKGERGWEGGVIMERNLDPGNHCPKSRQYSPEGLLYQIGRPPVPQDTLWRWEISKAALSSWHLSSHSISACSSMHLRGRQKLWWALAFWSIGLVLMFCWGYWIKEGWSAPKPTTELGAACQHSLRALLVLELTSHTTWQQLAQWSTQAWRV